MKKAVIFIATLTLVAITLIGVMTAQYTDSYEYKSNRFEDGYIINGVRCYGLNYDQATEKIEAEWNSRDILVVGALDEPLAIISEHDCTFDIAGQVARVKKDHKILSAMNYYLNIPVSVNISMKVSSCSDEFTRSVKDLDFLSRGDVTESRDAYVDLKDPDFRIVKEVYGNKPDAEQFMENVIECIELGQTKMVFADENYVDIPKVKSDDPKLLKYQKFCRENLDRKISYDLGDYSYTLSREDLLSILKDDLSGDADEDAVAKFVTKIAEKYDNVGKDRTFRTFAGKTITIEDAQYGWQVDQEKEKEKLIEDIASGKDVSREPEWSSRGFGEYSQDIGDTYVDIDISEQKLNYFADGSNAFSTDVVTGCKNTGHSTPTGLYSVLNKARNVTLKGRNSNGSKYSSFVSYWMAFIGSSYGMHDASWRSEFGGDIYISNGSHGCVNVPPDRMPELYEKVDYNTPVIVHY